MVARDLFPERSCASYDDEEPRTWYQVRGSSVLARAGRTSAAGVAVLAVDADGEVAQAGHDAWEAADIDLGVVLAEGAVADVVQAVVG
jgi:hypothetical protein